VLQVPWRAVARNKPFWAILLAHAGWGFGHGICFAWLPAYYAAEYGLPVHDSAWLSALPWICTVAVTLTGGGTGDWFVNRDILSRQEVRKLFQIIGMVGPAACLMYLAAAADHSTPELSLDGAVALMCATLSLGGLTSNGHASNHQVCAFAVVLLFAVRHTVTQKLPVHDAATGMMSLSRSQSVQ
jgi:Major Facilitator Superfamily